MDRRVCGVLLAACVVLVICGCGGPSGPETVPVSGTVLYKGQPVEGASVSFLPANATHAATGNTDAQGKFTLATAGKSGAVVGKHSVAISKVAAGSYQMPDEEAMRKDPTALTKMMQGNKPPKSELPDKYANPQSSGLSANVEKGKPNEFNFELTD